MNLQKPKILVIDDLISDDDPLMVELVEKYGQENVFLKNDSETGIAFIQEHLAERLVVLLDYHLGTGSQNGSQVLKRIRSKTSLIYTIIMTAADLNHIGVENYIDLINNQTMAFVKKAIDDYTKIIDIVGQAVHSLDSRVDCILEEWLGYFPEADRKKPYMTMSDNKNYSLDDIIKEIRMGTDIGKLAEKGIIKSAIDLLTKEE